MKPAKLLLWKGESLTIASGFLLCNNGMLDVAHIWYLRATYLAVLSPDVGMCIAICGYRRYNSAMTLGLGAPHNVVFVVWVD